MLPKSVEACLAIADWTRSKSSRDVAVFLPNTYANRMFRNVSAVLIEISVY